MPNLPPLMVLGARQQAAPALNRYAKAAKWVGRFSPGLGAWTGSFEIDSGQCHLFPTFCDMVS